MKNKDNTRLYNIWYNMKDRCNNKRHIRYKNYGGRGIRVCKDWLIFENFKKWALSNGYIDGLTIDRIDNDKGYSPDNCQWITRYENTSKGSKGRTLSLEARKKLSEIHTGANNLRSKKVRCIDTNQVFDCISEASRVFRVCDRSIRRCLAGERNKAGGVHWQYISEREGADVEKDIENNTG